MVNLLEVSLGHRRIHLRHRDNQIPLAEPPVVVSALSCTPAEKTRMADLLGSCYLLRVVEDYQVSLFCFVSPFFFVFSSAFLLLFVFEKLICTMEGC